MERLRSLALNGNGTASPYVPLLGSELLALLDEIVLLRTLLQRACDELDELGSKEAFRLRNKGGLDP